MVFGPRAKLLQMLSLEALELCRDPTVGLAESPGRVLRHETTVDQDRETITVGVHVADEV